MIISDLQSVLLRLFKQSQTQKVEKLQAGSMALDRPTSYAFPGFLIQEGPLVLSLCQPVKKKSVISASARLHQEIWGGRGVVCFFALFLCHTPVLRAYSWHYTWGCLFLVGLGGPFRVLAIEPRPAACKESTLHTALSVQSPQMVF